MRREFQGGPCDIAQMRTSGGSEQSSDLSWCHWKQTDQGLGRCTVVGCSYSAVKEAKVGTRKGEVCALETEPAGFPGRGKREVRATQDDPWVLLNS